MDMDLYNFWLWCHTAKYNKYSSYGDSSYGDSTGMSLTANDIWTNVYTESGHVVAAKKCVWGVGAASPTGWPTNLDLHERYYKL